MVRVGGGGTIVTNKRYVDREMDARILEGIAQSGPLESLSPAELRLDTEVVSVDPMPKPVRAWVRFGSTPVLVDAEACRWTADAVGVRFTVGDARHQTWVWASAVTPRT